MATTSLSPAWWMEYTISEGKCGGFDLRDVWRYNFNGSVAVVFFRSGDTATLSIEEFDEFRLRLCKLKVTP